MSNVTHTMPRRPLVEHQISMTERLYAERLQPSTLQSVAEIIRISTMWLVSVLAFRGLIAFLAAGHPNRLYSLLEFLTYPFVAPFQALFAYDMTVFEVYTAVAMLAYAVIGWSGYHVVKLLHSVHTGQYWERE